MPEEMSIDDRLRFLLTSTESLHASSQELHQTVARMAEEAKRESEKQAELVRQFNRHRRALITAIRAYLENDLEEGV